MSQENIFNLPQPEFYDCYVERYHSNLNVLRLRAERFDDPSSDAPNIVEMVFSDVLFYEGPFIWTGANFCVAPPEECLDILHYARLLNGADEEEVEETLEAYQLFVVKTTSGFAVKFVAHHEDYAMTIIG